MEMNAMNTSVEKTFEALLASEKIQKALAYLEQDQENKLRELKEMTLVSGAPHTETEIRTPMFRAKLDEYGMQDSFIDEIGNTFGWLYGRDTKSPILMEAHLDTVFDLETPLIMQEDESGILRCPGIADNTASMAAELSLLRAIREADLKPVKSVLIGGTVGEEAPGEARGVRHLMETMKDLSAYLCLDSGHFFDIITGAVACKRHEITLKGPGGHSWSDWGRVNAVHALGRAIGFIADIEPASHPKTTYNVGVISGGSTVNTISAQASMHIDIRSLDNEEKKRLEERILECVRKSVDIENSRHPDSEPLVIIDRPYGDKPGGQFPDDAPIVQAALASAKAIDLPRAICEPASTNANFPISEGIPCLCINSNGACGNMHSVNEWYDPKDSWKGAQALLLLLFAVAGLEGVTEPLSLS